MLILGFWNLLLFLGTFLIAVFWTVDRIITAVFSFILIFFIAAQLLFIIKAEFISILLIMIYLGGVAVLFIFITITISYNTTTEPLRNTNYTLFWRTIIALCLLKSFFSCDFLESWILSNTLKSNFNTNNLVHNYLYNAQDIFIFSNLLYTEFGLVLILIGIILLWTLIGSLSLATKVKD